MGLIRHGDGRVTESTAEPVTSPVESYRSFDDYLAILKYAGQQYGVVQYTTQVEKQEQIGRDFGSLSHGALKASAVVAACMGVRMRVFSGIEFTFRRRGRKGTFGTAELAPLERPWPGATTADLLARMEQDAGLAGSAFVVRRGNNVLRRLDPSWIDLVIGSTTNKDVEPGDIDAEIVGFRYYPGGRQSGRTPVPLRVEEVCHYMPLPDPTNPHKGMSWLTPAIREIMGDKAATDHKLKFFENGATPNHAVKFGPDVADPDEFEKWVEIFRERNEGIENAYKSLMLSSAMDVIPMGTDMQQLDFKATQGAGETRIAAAAGVHPVIVGLSEGLQGASLNSGNFAAARRSFIDGTMWYLWNSACGSLEQIIPTEPDAQLWFDTSGVPMMAEDKMDLAKIQQAQAVTMKTLVDAAFVPDSIVAAVDDDDWTQLQHTGLNTIQVQPVVPPGDPAAKNGTKTPDTVPAP